MANRKGTGVVAHSSRPSDPPAPHPTSDIAHPAPARPLAYKKTFPRRDQRDLLIGFGQIVRAARIRRAFSQEDLAARARIHRTHISLAECGRRELRLTTICALAFALRVNPGELMPVLFPPAPPSPPPPSAPPTVPAQQV